MQVSVEKTSTLEHRMTIGVPAERVEIEVNKRLQRAAKGAKIPGFRPGKVPMNIVRQRYEASARQEAFGDLVQATFYEAIVEHKLNPAGSPDVKPNFFEKAKGLEYVATFEVYPDFEVSGFEKISIERLQSEVTDSDVKKMLDVLRKQNATFSLAKRSAILEDKLNINFSGKINGDVFPGSSAENTDLVLGSGQMIPGFEDGLIGANAGDERIINPVFPDDYQNTELAGKAAEFTVTINSISEPKLPELNENFFKLFGFNEGGVDEFRAEVKKNMERELKQALAGKTKTQVMDGLLEISPIEVPKALITEEIDRLKAQAVQQFGGNINPDQLPSDLFEDQAKRRVSLGLIISKVVKQFDLTPEKQKVDEFITNMAAAYQEPKEVISLYQKDEQKLNEVRSVVLEEQVVDAILEKAQVTDKAVSYEDGIKPIQ
ncbi:UNVERIFIED_CONTAM: hypothetical protein GTU68_040912 [Idotea baltica]|nr:hypothetical protein [Idotea baltica]